MAKPSEAAWFKDTYEWRYKTTLDDTLTVEKLSHPQERRLIMGLLWIALSTIIVTILPALTGVLVSVFMGVAVGLSDVVLSARITPDTLFICREGLGLKTGSTFLTIPFIDIQHVSTDAQKLVIQRENAELSVSKRDYPPHVFEGLKQIMQAEGFLGQAYPYRIYFTPDHIAIEEKPASKELSTHERFSKHFRYYDETTLDTLDLANTRLLGLKRLKERTAAIEFKSIKVLRAHPSNEAMKQQKTDRGMLVFSAFEVVSLTVGATLIAKPFKTLRDLIHGMTLKAVLKESGKTYVMTMENSEKMYQLRFTATALYVGFNALESDTWYRV